MTAAPSGAGPSIDRNRSNSAPTPNPQALPPREHHDPDRHRQADHRLEPRQAAGVTASAGDVGAAFRGAAAVSAAVTLERTTFRTSRLLDFASEKELVAQIGHQKDAWPVVILREAVDNAVDAAEEAGTPPAVTVTVDRTGILVEDNGPGIPADVVEDILDFSVRVSSREAYVSPTRGAQGNALKTILAMPFVLDGQCGGVEVEARGVRHVIDFGVDRIRQRPIVEHRVDTGDVAFGTRIKVEWPDSARSILEGARAQFLQIAGQYAWLNPHLTITIDWFGERSTEAATDPAWSKWKPSDPTSPHWYTDERFGRLIAGYIAHDTDRGRMRTVRELVTEFRGLSGTAKQKAVLGATGLAREPLTALVNGRDLDHAAVARLLKAMKISSRPVKPRLLGSIGRTHFQTRFAAAGCEMDSFDYRRVMDTTDGVPWIVETAFGWRPSADARRLVCGVNWSPGIINPFRELGRFGQSLDTILTQQRADRDEPVILVLHMACPRVEYTDRGKSAVVVRS
jgi:DNA topoisomerase VI subunit B